MKYYVVSDVHGYCTLLKRALKRAGFFDEREACRLIVCGDLLDRGPEAVPLIAFMQRLRREGRLIYVLGNHEELMVECLRQIARGGVYEVARHTSHHYINKTWDSLLQISEMSETEACSDPQRLVRRVTHSPFYGGLLADCVDYYETPHYVFTHGWIPCLATGRGPHAKHRYDADWRRAGEQRWRLARWYNGMEMACRHHVCEPGKTVVCGHVHASYGHACIRHTCCEWGRGADFSPFRADGVMAIDACTAYSGRVNVIVIED